jgi:hypothetical protein
MNRSDGYRQWSKSVPHHGILFTKRMSTARVEVVKKEDEEKCEIEKTKAKYAISISDPLNFSKEKN